MEKRNQFLEADGLYWESDTHEWFHDKSTTSYAQKNQFCGTTEMKDSLTNIYCFIVRDKNNGEYNYVILDSKKNEVIYDSKKLEDLAFYIDKLKIEKRFNL